MSRLVIATRRSRLALWQAEHVKARLEALPFADLCVKCQELEEQGLLAGDDDDTFDADDDDSESDEHGDDDEQVEDEGE